MHWFWRAAIAVVIAYGFRWAMTFPINALILPRINYDNGSPPQWFWYAFALVFTLAEYAVLLASYTLLTRSFASSVTNPETRCRQCGYILRGITEPRCPECGEVI